MNFLKKIGFINTDIITSNKNKNQKFIDFNIYQILSYIIYNNVNNNTKYFNIQNKNLQINTNKSGLLLETNIILNPIIKNKNNNFLMSYICKSINASIIIKNLNKAKKYLIFLSIDGNISNKNIEYIKCNDYIFIYIEKMHTVSIQLENILDKVLNDCCLLELDNTQQNNQIIFNNIFNLPFFINDKKYFLSKLIAVWERESIITNILNEENTMNKDFEYCNILGYSNIKDIEYIKNNITNKENTIYFYTPNMPLGLKWKHIAEFSKLINTDYLMIQGSDDKILINKLNKKLISSYDFIGQNQWYVYDSNDKKKYLFNLNKSILKNSLYIIGAGRIINKNEVIRYNYNIFNPYKFKGLDYQMNCLAFYIKNKLISIPICESIKSGHSCLNPLNKYITSKNMSFNLI